MPVFDYSWARPDPSLLDEGVIRYLAPVGAPWPNKSVGKIIGLDELNALWAAGKKVGLVWEVDTNDADGGYDHGKDSGEHARAMARTLGYPDSVPIYVAVDKRLTDANRGTAVEYVSGFRDGAGLARPYGEAALIDACVAAGIADCGWMPETWGRSPNLALIQRVGTSPVDGTDANSVVRTDWGGWNPHDQPPPTPEPEDEVALSNDIIAIELAYAAHGEDADDAGKAYWQEQVAQAAPENRDAVIALMVSKLKK